MNYIIASGICAIALLIATFQVRENELLNKRQKRRFTALALVIFFEVIIDTAILHANGTTEMNYYLFKFLKVLEFVIAPIIPTLLAYLVSRKKCWYRIRKYFVVTIVINAVLQITTMFYPLMFQISENLEYSRTSFGILYIVILIVDLILFMYASTKTFVQNFRRFNSLVMIILFITLGFTMRVFQINSNVDWLCITFSYFLFQEFFANSYYKIDTLTSLLNQKAFLNRKAQIDFSTAFIAIDINNFKAINDIYGHAKGDICLSKIGEIIFNVYHEVGFCYRTGGDEFTIILKPGELDRINKAKQGSIYESLISLMRLLDAEIKKQSKEDALLKDGVSQGFGIYYTPEDCHKPGGFRTVDEALKYADERMYEAKMKRKR